MRRLGPSAKSICTVAGSTKGLSLSNERLRGIRLPGERKPPNVFFSSGEAALLPAERPQARWLLREDQIAEYPYDGGAAAAGRVGPGPRRLPTTSQTGKTPGN